MLWSLKLCRDPLKVISYAPITWAISRVLEALGQEPGTKTKYIFLIVEDDAVENGFGPPYFLLIFSGLSMPF